jgi:uncharacterized protein
LVTSRSILPFRQFVIKVHSRCDLACDHCYVYVAADQTWQWKPTVVALETVAKAAGRIAEHAARHGLPRVRVVLHGGEPLLAGAERLAQISRTLREVIEPTCQLDLRVHTNGVRLTAELCELFLVHQVKVGISLDGDRSGNDLHRRYADGRSSYDQAIRAIDLLRGEQYREIYAGLLCTIDVRNDPVACYRALAAMDPPDIDFLLPHSTWDVPPFGAGEGKTPYADWLIAVFDAWTADGRPVPIRVFDSIEATTRGEASRTEALGLSASDLVVIETDGSFEQADSIKVAYEGAPQTGMDIFRHTLDEAATHPAIQARQRGLAGLCSTCQECPVVTSCGGGLYAHRYRSGSGFANTSVFCADLLKLITYVRSRLNRDMKHSPVAADGLATGRTLHALASADFDALAAGYGGAATLGHLVEVQRSIVRTLLRLLRRRAGAAADAGFHVGWTLLIEVEKAAPEALASILSHPYVRTWATRCLTPVSGTDAARLPPDVDHLAGIAAAAAIRGGLQAQIDITAADGYVYLPTLGRMAVGPARTVSVSTGDGGFDASADTGQWHIRLADLDANPAWQPVRELRAGRFTVRIEDTDPYRDCHQWSANTRLTGSEVARWQDQFQTAMALIEAAYPAYAPALAAGFTTIMPLANDSPGRMISAAARQAFGAIGVALPASGADLALLLMHEFQHIKLGAVLDLFDLCDPADQRLYYAPWRDDPRPIEPLLQGAYAHLAVTDYWRVRRHLVAGSSAADAAERFARWRVLTAEAIETLAGSGALTQLGERFVAGLRATIDPWLGEQVPAAATAAASQWIAERRAVWQPPGGIGG